MLLNKTMHKFGVILW